MSARKRPAAPCPAEAAPIWEDGDGNPGPAPTGARAARRVITGDGIAVVHVDDPERHAEFLARHADAWRIERPGSTVSLIVRHRGPSIRTAGLHIVTRGVVDVSGAGRVTKPGELPELRWPL